MSPQLEKASQEMQKNLLKSESKLVNNLIYLLAAMLGISSSDGGVIGPSSANGFANTSNGNATGSVNISSGPPINLP